MQANCAQCGRAFEGKTRRATYCSGACKKRAADKRKRMGQVIPMRPPVDPPSEPDCEGGDGALVASLRDAFKPGDLDTPAGVIAVRLAKDVDRLTPGTPGYAAIVKQMREAVDDLRAQATPRAATPLTLLQERRAADRAASAG